jgi:hypothetical protein
MSWAQRLKRVFGIEIERCAECGGALKIIASIEDPEVIGRILQHLGLAHREDSSQCLPAVRAPPSGSASDSSSPIRCSCGSRSVVRYGIAPRCREPRRRSVLSAPWARHAVTIAETQLAQPPLAVAMPQVPDSGGITKQSRLRTSRLYGIDGRRPKS